MIAFVVVTAVLSLAAQGQPSVPLEWDCAAFQYGSNDGCDCGCGVVDPDCGVDDVSLLDRATCRQDGCGPGRVPAVSDASRCTDNVCGDGYVGGPIGSGEQCDDSTQAAGLDGCSADCATIEPGFRCSKEGGGCRVPGCGDGQVDVGRFTGSGESCDDGPFADGDGVDGDGCSASCQAEPGFVCFTFQPCHATICGDGFVEIDFETRSGEGCDDGNADPDDGCDRCVTQPGFVCDPFAPGGSVCSPVVCGNGLIERDPIGRGESCDDNNVDDDDGCNSDCQTEDGFSCDRGPCERVECGDGILTPPLEQCDDDNTVGGDGCAADCSTPEPGFFCGFDGLGTPCHRVVCGDGVQEGDNFGLFEQCDDGNARGDDGCAADCTGVEPGFICPAPGQLCQRPVCGDGVINGPNFGGNEACDDGNATGGDGCPADCTAVEAGFFCPAAGEPCLQPVCGDSVVQGDESCDDGNTDDGDGCARKCDREDDFVCRVPGSPCEPLPAAWACSRFVYGSGDGCDCGCGVVDPDCAVPLTLGGCDFNQCLEAAPFLDGADPTACSTVPPPPDAGNEGEGEAPAEGEGEDDPRLAGGGCQGCDSAGSGSPWGLPLGLAWLFVVVDRRRRRLS